VCLGFPSAHVHSHFAEEGLSYHHAAFLGTESRFSRSPLMNGAARNIEDFVHFGAGTTEGQRLVLELGAPTWLAHVERPAVPEYRPEN